MSRAGHGLAARMCHGLVGLRDVLSTIPTLMGEHGKVHYTVTNKKMAGITAVSFRNGRKLESK